MPEVLAAFAFGQNGVVLDVRWNGIVDVEGIFVWRHNADGIVDDNPGSGAIPVIVEFAETGDSAGTWDVSERAG